MSIAYVSNPVQRLYDLDNIPGFPLLALAKDSTSMVRSLRERKIL